MDESPRKLCSVITPTWQRRELLLGAIENVIAQTYRPLEHVIISDGTDPETSRLVVAVLDCADRIDPSVDVSIRFVPLGRNWSSFLADSFCAAPMVVGQLVASGEYQTWLADDERMTPDHIESLVDALEEQDAHFAYSQTRMYRPGQHPDDGYVIGSAPASYGQITNVLYRTDVLKWGLYPFHHGYRSDWDCINRWLAFGARSAFVERVTLTHRIDH